MKLSPNDIKEIKLQIDNLKFIYELMNKNQRLFSRECWFVENIILKLKARLIRS